MTGSELLERIRAARGLFADRACCWPNRVRIGGSPPQVRALLSELATVQQQMLVPFAPVRLLGMDVEFSPSTGLGDVFCYRVNSVPAGEPPRPTKKHGMPVVNPKSPKPQPGPRPLRGIDLQ